MPWLDVPASWSRHVENGVVSVMPNDLSGDASFILMVEPPQKVNTSLQQSYEQALRDLGPWQAVGEPVEDYKPDSWAYRFGVGVATLNKQHYTALTVVAQHRQQRVRMWVLASSDETYNRYQHVIGSALASIQDVNTAPVAASTTVISKISKLVKPDPEFGKGISGVYVGVERGLSASAGVGSGTQQVFNQSSGRIENSNTGTATQIATQITDYAEVDVFYPDGTYRRRMPVRGMASDFSWERQQQAILWGSWKREGKQLIVQRGNYTTRYTIENDTTLISDRGLPWRKLTIPENAKIDGVYARDDYRDAAAPRLILRADGSYEDRGDFLRMVGSAWNLLEPDGNTMVKRWNDAEAKHVMRAGKGSYSFNYFTLTLRGNDDRVWQFNIYVPPGENPAKPGKLVINGRVLLRD